MNITAVLYIAMILGGAFFVILAVLQALKAKKAAEAWPTAAGRILTSEIEVRRTRSDSGTRTSYLPKVSYQYRVGGQDYTASSIGFGQSTYGQKKAEQILAQYPQGATVMVHYDPADPSKAVLEPRAAGFWNYLILGIILLAAGVVSAWVLR